MNIEAVRQVVARVGVPCQLGGGIRDEATIAAWLEAGIERVVVGTQALRDPEWFGRMAEDYPGRLLLGLDAREGRVATAGWIETSSIAALALARQFDALPIAGMIYTDIARDGTLDGPEYRGHRRDGRGRANPRVCLRQASGRSKTSSGWRSSRSPGASSAAPCMTDASPFAQPSVACSRPCTSRTGSRSSSMKTDSRVSLTTDYWLLTTAQETTP